MPSPQSLPDFRKRVSEAFEAALDVADDMRLDWLAQNYGNEPEVAEQAARLLEQEAGSRALFSRLERQRESLLGDVMFGDEEQEDPRLGASYGAWRVLAHRGTGGLAEVYEVSRDDGRYEQRAALKILRCGMLGDYARELFLRERRLLAALDHPGIVRILDAGETSTGAPWLVMELAEGEAIDRYCNEHWLPLEERLSLIAQVADILQAAHARLVVHGDIKPEHVLIGKEGKVRLLDFGIAQALDEQGRGRNAEGFTPEHASPEQAASDTLGTASDIYQLGRLLEQVTRSCKGDGRLDAIVEKASRPDPAERYAAMADFAADIRAFLADSPIAARPDTRSDAFLRFVRHNRLASALVVALLFGSGGWALTATLSAHALERQRTLAVSAADRERRGKDVLLELFRRADMLEADSLGLEPGTAAHMLDDTLAAARLSLTDDPAMLANLMNWAARAHMRAGNNARALELAQESLDRIGQAGMADTMRAGAAHAFLANAQARAGNVDAAKVSRDTALNLLTTSSPDDRAAIDLLIAAAWSREGDWEKQRSLFQSALGKAEKLRDSKAMIEIRSGLGRALAGLGRIEEARSHIEQALGLVRASYGARHPRLALPLSDLARMEERAGNAQAAVILHRQALAISEAAFGPAHASTLSHRNNLALALQSAGQPEAAIAQLRLLLSQQPDGLARGEVAQNLGASLVEAGQYASAEQVLALAERLFSAHLPADHPRRVFPALTRSEMRLAQQRYAEAEADARKAFAHLDMVLPSGHFATETARCRIGMAMIGEGRSAEAAAYLRPAVKALESARAPARYLEPCRRADRSI
ncbi:serine/threonine-protein kinase [Novosphingobium naphthalenivorans]|uniref:serine/threonine-protein kinase n=1 Tax=Novosphingobium naphthalenivorans TaxID=273168 RepID=UPI000835E573|nr:serine/threonine-protein kinase [Novosphingobium naphthalenivorans]